MSTVLRRLRLPSSSTSSFSSSSSSTRPPRPSTWRFYLSVFTATLKSLALLHLLHERAYTVCSTHGPSMLPGWPVAGTRYLVDRGARRGGRGGGGVVVPGDVVVFDSVVEPGQHAIKRVVAVEGDYVLRRPPDEQGSSEGVMFMVPKGHCWVEGDNLPWSRDSRLFGPLPLACITGKVIARVWPLRQMQWIESGLTPVDHD